MLEQQSEVKVKRMAAQKDLDKKIDAKYPRLTEAEITALVVEDKWMARLSAAVQSEIDRVSQTLTGRICQLAERYAMPLPSNECMGYAASRSSGDVPAWLRSPASRSEKRGDTDR